LELGKYEGAQFEAESRSEISIVARFIAQTSDFFSFLPLSRVTLASPLEICVSSLLETSLKVSSQASSMKELRRDSLDSVSAGPVSDQL